MRWKDYINAEEVRRALSIFQEPGAVFEIRAIGTAKKDIISGYFRDADTMLAAFDTIDLRKRNVYITLGRVKSECFARAQSERFLKTDQTTSDNEIISYRWLFVDLDPKRTAGISSTNEELAKASELSWKVYEYLKGLGFEEPVRAMSGNGIHLLYRIDIPNDESSKALVEKCLKVIASVFDTEAVNVDTTTYNPSRVCKLHGTLAQKGTSTKERPHRMSMITQVPDEIKITDRAVLQKLADELPDDKPPEKRPRAGGGLTQKQDFDLLGFMSRHGLTYKEDSNDRATIYKLDHCPFDSSHTDGDAKIFHYHNGAIAFKCHHNSCRQYKWQDVRLKFEPDAYDIKEDDWDRIDDGYRQHLRKKAEEGEAPKPAAKARKKTPRKLKTAEALMEKDLPEPKVLIGTGSELPLLVEGTCILSAKPKLGKSWLALSMCVAVANGEPFLGYETRKCSTLYLDLETSEQLQQKRLRKVLDGAPVPKNFYLETETDPLDGGFIEQIEAYLAEDPDIGIVVIDVFQIIRSPSKSIKESEYEHAYRDITPLNELAQKHHISIILVCHDRKTVDPDDPFSNILGSTGLQGAATQMMVMFRKRKDDPIHISVKGKTIDGLPELNVKLENAKWSIVEGVDTSNREAQEMLQQYLVSDVRQAVLKIVEQEGTWRGRCSDLINKAIDMNIPITDSPKYVGGFMNKHRGRFLKEDGIQVTIVDKGTASKIYKIEKFTISTISHDDYIPFLTPDKSSVYAVLGNPFL